MSKISNSKEIHFNTTHGLSKHPLWSVWSGMRKRCYRTKDKEYKNYGGRGISVCEGWRYDFLDFYKWAIANGWEVGLKLDRMMAIITLIIVNGVHQKNRQEIEEEIYSFSIMEKNAF